MHLRTFENFRPYIDRRAISAMPNKEIGYLRQPVEIRVEIEKPAHAEERRFRHGVDNVISDGDIIETVELAIEELTIALMQDRFDIYQNEDDYPTKGVKAGEPNRFVIRNIDSGLNLVCILKPGENEFKLIVITVMNKLDFRTYSGQYVIEVK